MIVSNLSAKREIAGRHHHHASGIAVGREMTFPDSEFPTLANSNPSLRFHSVHYSMATMTSLLTPLRRPLPRPSFLKGPTNTSNIADDRLKAAAERFFVFKTQLKQLAAALLENHKQDKQTRLARLKLLHALSALSVESPIAGLVGAPVVADAASSTKDGIKHESLDDGIVGENAKGEEAENNVPTEKSEDEQSDTAASVVTSYHALQANFVEQLENLVQCQEEMLEYVKHWDQVVTSRVCAELRYVKKLQSNWLSYEMKVESLKASVAKKQIKNKPVDKDLSKVARNETKLRRTRKEYNNNVIRNTVLIEEITLRAFRDLIPLLMKLLEYDAEVAKQTTSLVDPLKKLKGEIQSVCSRFDMTDDVILSGRLQQLLEEDAIDFARPEDIEDIGAIEAYTVCPTIGSVYSSGEENQDGKMSPPPQDAAGAAAAAATDDGPSDDDGIMATPDKQQTHIGIDDEKKEHGKEDSPQKAMIGGGYLPSSFYILVGGENEDDNHEDDLTTLTPYTRCERRVSI